MAQGNGREFLGSASRILCRVASFPETGFRELHHHELSFRPHCDAAERSVLREQIRAVGICRQHKGGTGPEKYRPVECLSELRENLLSGQYSKPGFQDSAGYRVEIARANSGARRGAYSSVLRAPKGRAGPHGGWSFRREIHGVELSLIGVVPKISDDADHPEDDDAEKLISTMLLEKVKGFSIYKVIK